MSDVELKQWSNLRERTTVIYQKGGPGNPWKLFSEQGEFGALSGGGVGLDSRWGRNNRGASVYLGAVETGDPDRTTFPLTARINVNDMRSIRQLLQCRGTAIALVRCGELFEFTEFEAGMVLWDSGATSRDTSDMLANAIEGTEADITWSFPMSAGFQEELVRLRHSDISGAVSDAAINKMIAVGIQRCAGDCGEDDTGEEDFWFVTDSDSTPGYQGQGAAVFGFTRDGGTFWTTDFINTMVGGNAVDVAQVGSYAVVAGDSHGVSYALIDDLYQEVAAPWNSSNWPSASNFPNALKFSGSFGLAVGDGGFVWVTKDGGFTWRELDAGVLTTQDLNDVELSDENNGWIVGANGTLIRFASGVLSLVPNVTVRALDNTTSTLSTNLTVAAIPSQRSKQLYFADAVGDIYFTRDNQANNPEFRQISFPDMGEGSISDLVFSSFRGGVMWILQRNAAGKDRVIRDLTGGGGSAEGMRLVDTYTSPGNSGINSIAPANMNFAMTGGELNQTNAFIGKVAQR